jgi:hypothetical protein
VDHLARGGLVQRGAAFHDPVGQAVAAKSGKAHKINILCVMPVSQMSDKLTKGRRRM